MSWMLTRWKNGKTHFAVWPWWFKKQALAIVHGTHAQIRTYIHGHSYTYDIHTFTGTPIYRCIIAYTHAHFQVNCYITITTSSSWWFANQGGPSLTTTAKWSSAKNLRIFSGLQFSKSSGLLVMYAVGGGLMPEQKWTSVINCGCTRSNSLRIPEKVQGAGRGQILGKGTISTLNAQNVAGMQWITMQWAILFRSNLRPGSGECGEPMVMKTDPGKLRQPHWQTPDEGEIFMGTIMKQIIHNYPRYDYVLKFTLIVFNLRLVSSCLY